MRLHRAGALPVIDAERVAGLRLVETGEQREAGRRAKAAAIGRPEKPHRRARAQAQGHRDIDAGNNRADQPLAGNPALALGPAEEAGSTAAIGCTTAPSWTQSNSWQCT